MPFWIAVKTLASTANGMLSIVPALVWALLLTGSVLHGCGVSLQRDHARAELKTIKAAVTAQNIEAAAKFKTKTDEAKALETQLKAFRAAQEKTDAANKTTVADLSRKLRAAGGLRDPGRPSGGSPAGQAPAATADRAGDAPSGAGLLSESFTAMLLADAARADEINLAYISARADALSLRELIGKLGSCTPP